MERPGFEPGSLFYIKELLCAPEREERGLPRSSGTPLHPFICYAHQQMKRALKY